MNKVLESVTQRMMCAAIIAVSLSSLVAGQQQDRIVDWQSVDSMSDARVLQIVNVKVGGEPITISQPFKATDDWLNALTFTVKNISGKRINLFGFGVAFPEINPDGHTPMFSVTYGANYSSNDSSARKPLSPDEEVDLKLPEDQLEIMRRVLLNTTGRSYLNKVNILPGLVNFEDGSRIGGISLRRQVPE